MSGTEEPLGRAAARTGRERAIAEPTLERIGAQLTAHCGLAFGSHNRPDLVRAVWSVVSELGLASPEHLASLVEHPTGAGKLARLVSELTVRESYFFRLPEQFAYLRTRVVPELVRQRRARGSDDRTLRAWSAGCAGGEEAYSLAIALHEAVDPGWNVEVLGTDINASYLDQARAADYSPWSLRGVDEIERARYFVPGDRGTRRVREDLRRLVRFAPLNLAGAGYPDAGARTGGLDVVFCRNVFIYFDAEVVTRVATRLATCLHDAGFAFFGPSDPLPARIAGLERVAARGATMIFRRPGERAAAARGSELGPAHRPSSSARGTGREGAQPAPVAPRPSRVKSEPAPPPELERVRRLALAGAARGAVADAERWAEQWVALEPSSAPAHYLLGHLRGAEGRRVEAAASLRRALYFDPSFALASFGMAELVAADGHAAEARGFLLNALEALRHRSDRDVLPGSDEITAEWLRRIITSRLASARDAR